MSARWTALSGSTIGSVHVRDDLPLQDAHLVRVEDGTSIMAVADGHGHHLHFRSDVGSRLAVRIVVDLLADALPRLTAVPAAEGVLAEVGTALVERWTAAVLDHLAAHPVDAESVGLVDRARLTQPYGTTLLAMVATGDVLGILQIGDGDAVVVTTDGVAARPLPEDPALDGTRTTSLCQPDPLDALRLAVLDAQGEDIALGYLCTDGFSAARVDTDGWWRQTGAELVAYVRDRGLAWVEDRLPGWLEEPARVGGDDTTLALLVREDLASDDDVRSSPT
ncbi:PP2C family serine/threonine-protein phosphatase [Nocardioides sp. cx-173]|uniref:PP2C family serine/threonine-protein phosphatase n=1 Tax=Nocardioides sp. cx-173 TaxID=2898796 RepID=UPI001E5AA8C6|nr:PP2C family serine/threonine-protein phosphatase [Nocardioides sp. cx-173]MCD4524544.1 protein phosphatase 2C domain-containing protein [Nocardioides sp. cx-173]UGB42971.1 protein phosphatase 2C domain-containing protein [Nocardioides sp. cx-173]